MFIRKDPITMFMLVHFISILFLSLFLSLYPLRTCSSKTLQFFITFFLFCSNAYNLSLFSSFITALSNLNTSVLFDQLSRS